MKYTIRDHMLLYVTICFAIQACSSTKNLDREQSPLMTIRIDGSTLSVPELYNLTAAVNQTNLFYAVDRHEAFSTAKDELYLQQSNQVPPVKRYLQSSEIQGAGSILLASQQCSKMMTWLSGSPFYRCTQSLTLMDGSTSMIIHSVSNQVDGELGFAQPSWSATVSLFSKSIPSRFEHQKSASLVKFEQGLKP